MCKIELSLKIVILYIKFYTQQKTLKEAGKELAENQLERIIQDKQTENPLFLKIILNVRL